MSQSLSAVLTAAFIICFSLVASVPCRQGWLQFEESCYGFGEQLVSWEDAQEVCRSAGSRLVEIESSTENEFLKSQARQKGGDYWAGASDIFQEGTWTWMSTGALLHPFSDWAAGEPNDGSQNQDCLLINSRFDYQWDDGTCSYNANFICETGLDETVVG